MIQISLKKKVRKAASRKEGRKEKGKREGNSTYSKYMSLFVFVTETGSLFLVDTILLCSFLT